MYPCFLSLKIKCGTQLFLSCEKEVLSFDRHRNHCFGEDLFLSSSMNLEMIKIYELLFWYQSNRVGTSLSNLSTNTTLCADSNFDYYRAGITIAKWQSICVDNYFFRYIQKPYSSLRMIVASSIEKYRRGGRKQTSVIISYFHVAH